MVFRMFTSWDEGAVDSGCSANILNRQEDLSVQAYGAYVVCYRRTHFQNCLTRPWPTAWSSNEDRSRDELKIVFTNIRSFSWATHADIENEAVGDKRVASGQATKSCAVRSRNCEVRANKEPGDTTEDSGVGSFEYFNVRMGCFEGLNCKRQKTVSFRQFTYK